MGARLVRTRGSTACAAAAMLGVLLGFDREAAAEVVVGIEPRAELTFRDGPRFGPSLGLSIGYSLDLYPLLLAPEIELGGAIFPGSAWFGALRAMAGLRAGFTASVEPSIFAHVGYGLAGPREGSDDSVGHGLGIDAGAALEGRLSRLVTLGAAVSYQGIVAGEESLHGLAAGARLGLWF